MTWNDYTSIAHWAGIEMYDGLLIHRNTIDGLTWVRIYRGTPERAQYVAQLKQGKKGGLTHYIDGRRFRSVETALAFYRKAV